MRAHRQGPATRLSAKLRFACRQPKRSFGERPRANSLQPAGMPLFAAGGRRAPLPMCRIAAQRAPTPAAKIGIAALLLGRNPG
jgi:hypothetical protein